MSKVIKKLLRKAGKYMTPAELYPTRDETSLMLMGKQLSRLNSMVVERPNDLSKFEFKVFSQWGEDGIIDWLVDQLSPLPEIFIEFGVEDYTEANTRFLLMNRNWRGLVIDGSRQAIEKVRRSDLHWRHDLTAQASFITRDNINKLFRENGFSDEIGLLSVDIDGNDYWVWEAINSINPAIVVAEYCAHFGDLHAVSIPYKEDFTRHSGHFSGQYFGASLKALTYLGSKKGYTFIGTNSAGINAFFVRNDLLSKLDGKRPPAKSFPMRASDTRDETRKLTFVHGPAKADLIKHLPVIEVNTGKEVKLNDLGELYSNDWLKAMSGYLS